MNKQELERALTWPDNRYIESIQLFMEGADQTTGIRNDKQIQLYITLVLEETIELLEALHVTNGFVQSLKRLHAFSRISDLYNSKNMDDNGVEEIIDAVIDITWVAFGLLFSLGVDVEGVAKELTLNNFSKFNNAGKAEFDHQGKLLKPTTWEKPNFKQYIRSKGDYEI